MKLIMCKSTQLLNVWKVYFDGCVCCLFAAPPSEVDLLQNTLWVEVMKLYGHGYEIYSVASHPDGSIIASACKVQKTGWVYGISLLWNN